MLKGRVARLAVLDFGLFRVHAGPRDIGLMGFLVETDAGERVLIDTGMPAKYAADPERAAVEDGLDAFGTVLALGAENAAEGQLAALGFGPADIDIVVLTHSHIDHVGGIGCFPDALLVVGAAERALARPLYWGAAQPLEWPGMATVAVAEDRAVCDGLRLLMAPGHAPGQTALLVRLPDTRPVLLASDAISRPGEVAEGFVGAWDPAAAQASAARPAALAAEEGALVIYGHDPEQWPLLRKAPAVYT
jgi:N-acyl homoserine lactone hydrolase